MTLTNRDEDDDASHLPPGMERVGYDADTERYTFREGDDLWLGEPGLFYGGKLKWVRKAPEAEEDDADTYSSGTEHTDRSGHKTTLKPPREHARESTQNDINDSSWKVADDAWGVPVASISDTSARPPDSPKEDNSIQMRARRAKRVAMLKANALGIFKWRSRNGTQ